MPVAVVTGSSSGIGRATAIALADRGYHVVVHARNNLAGLHETISLIRDAHGDQRRVLALTGDIASPEHCRNLAYAAFHWQGSVHAWINNAGADVLTGPIADASFEHKLDLLLAVDVKGTIQLSRLAADLMLSQTNAESRKPCIINIGWDQADSGMEDTPGQLFCTSKSAIAGYTKALAHSLAPAIRVNCVQPGWIKTKWGEDAPEKWSARAIGESLLNRWGEPEDVARAICWLVSPDADFINSQCVPVNGGFRSSRGRE